MTNYQELEKSVLKLDIDARAALAEKLLQSLENLSEEENERLWLQEAKRRKEEMASGKAVLRDGEEVLRQLEAELQ